MGNKHTRVRDDSIDEFLQRQGPHRTLDQLVETSRQLDDLSHQAAREASRHVRPEDPERWDGME